jgi:hypothetical protein
LGMAEDAVGRVGDVLEVFKERSRL